MSKKSLKDVEQLTLEMLIDQAYETFSYSLKSIQAKVLLFGGFKEGSASIVVKAYFNQHKPHLADKRRKVSKEDAALLEALEQYAEDTEDYVRWVRNSDGLPVWQEALVSQCVAFETCVKAIAVAFYLAQNQSSHSLDAKIDVSSSELITAHKNIEKQWHSSKSNKEEFRIKNFFQSEICKKNPENSRVELACHASDEDWNICHNAFKVRNAIVHNLGRMRSNVDIGGEIFHEGCVARLNLKTIDLVGRVFNNIVVPFVPSLDI